MANQFGSSPTSPASRMDVITPADALLPTPARSLYVGTGGNVTVIPLEGPSLTPVTFVGVVGGSILPIAVRQVSLTGTTAGAIIGLR